MTTYALQGPPHAGATIALTVPAGLTGDLAPTGQGIGLLCINEGGTAITVTLAVTPTYDGLAVASRTVSVPIATGPIPGVSLIPLPDAVYGVGTTAVQYSIITQLQVASIRIP
jgi:hypothetical protein